MNNLPNQDATKKLKKVLIVSRTEASQLKDLLTKNSFKIVERNPDFVVCYGGDGTILFAERKFPQVPKLIVKRSKICRKCDYTIDYLEDALHRIREQKFKIREEMKLEAKFRERKLIGLNEIQVHTKLPIYAIRFSVVVDDREFDDLIGDGIIVATPFGSTAYYHSITRKSFEKGIGIAFNNPTKPVNHLVLKEDSNIEIELVRGEASFATDNDPKILDLIEGQLIKIKKAEETAKIIEIKSH